MSHLAVVVLMAVVIAAPMPAALAQLNDVFSDADVSYAVDAATATLSKTGSSVAPMEAYYSSLVLEHAGKGKSKPKAACAALNALLSASGSPIDEVSYAIRAADSLGCLDGITDGTKAVLKAGLKASSIADIYAAVSVVDIVKAHGKTLKPKWSSIVDRVTSLRESDGKFRESPSGPASAEAAGMAYFVLAAAWDAVKESADDTAKIKSATNAIGKLFDDADGSEATYLELGDGENRLFATSIAVSGAMHLAQVSGDDVDVQHEQLAAFGSYFLRHKSVADGAAQGQIVAGLNAISSPAAVMPLAVRMTRSSLRTGSKDKLGVFVTDVFGKYVTDAEVVLESATRSGDSRPLFSDAAFSQKKKDKSKYTVDFMSKAPTSGLYKLYITVNPSNTAYGSVESLERSVKVSTEVSVSEVQIIVAKSAKSDDSTAQRTSASYPNAASAELKAVAGNHLNIVFTTTSAASGEALYPHQAFLRMIHQDTGVSTIFVATPQGDSSTGTHVVSLDIGSREKLHEAADAGKYDMEIIIGDSTIENAIQWKIGSVDLTPPPPPAEKEEILYSKPLLHESDTTLKALPEIHHQFRAPDSRPPAVVSYFFTVLTLLPLLWLIGSLVGSSNASAFSDGGIFAMGFQVSLGAMLVLLAVYWLQLTMFSTLAYATVPGLGCLLFGQGLFRRLHAARVAKKDD